MLRVKTRLNLYMRCLLRKILVANVTELSLQFLNSLYRDSSIPPAKILIRALQICMLGHVAVF